MGWVCVSVGSIRCVCGHMASGHGVGLNLDMRLIMFSGKEKVLRILYIVQRLRNSLRSRVVVRVRA